jgi:HD-like signal output (HDOD) protein
MSNYDLLAQAACDIDPLAPTVHRLMSAVSGGDWHLDEVVEIVSFDPVLTAKLLRRVNSAASASRVEIINVKHAVSRIGISPLMSLVTAACLPRSTHSALPQYGLGEGEFWRHLVASSLAAEVVQRRSTQSLPPETSTAALLHDIGKLVIGRLVDRESLEYLECAREFG